MFLVDYKDARPIYEQVYDRMRRMIYMQVLHADEQLPSVRALAMELSINPNTIQKAYERLEEDGLVYVVKGRGNFVCKCDSWLDMKHKDMKEKCKKLVEEADLMGISIEELVNMVREGKEETDD